MIAMELYPSQFYDDRANNTNAFVDHGFDGPMDDGTAGKSVSNDNVMTNSSVHTFEQTPVYAQALIIVMYSTITVLAVGGNVIVCYIVLAYQRMRTVTNFFIFNLACSDILMSVLCIPFTFVANVLMQYWPFPDIMCPLVTYVQALSVFLSAFTLVAISLDRYRAIMSPLKPRMTKTQAIIVIIVIWILSVVVPLPIAILSKTEPLNNSSNMSFCVEAWPSPEQRYIYTLAIMVLQYFLPLFILIFTYTSIAIVIWGKQTPGEAVNNRDQRMAASKRKMVKMMITVVIIYALCWLPLHTITLVGDSYIVIYNYPYIQVVWTACHWLSMSNSCYNPIVYCWMNNRYRNGFLYVLRWCPFIKYRPEDHNPDVSMARRTTYMTTIRSQTTTENRTSRHNQGSPYSKRNSGYGGKPDGKFTQNGYTNGRKTHPARNCYSQNSMNEEECHKLSSCNISDETSM